MSDRQPTLQEAINAGIDRGMRSMYTLIPAKVVKWESDKQRVNCQILVKQVTEGEEGDREVASWPVIPGVPVQFIGAGGFRLTVPIEAGTTGSLIFSHRSMDKWLTGNGAEVDPEEDHAHGLADAVFFPGLMPFGAPWQDVPDGALSLGKDSGLQLKITGDVATLAETESNAQFVALANLVKARLDTIQSSYDAHKHTVSGASTGVPDTIIGSLAAVAASKVKAE